MFVVVFLLFRGLKEIDLFDLVFDLSFIFDGCYNFLVFIVWYEFVGVIWCLLVVGVKVVFFFLKYFFFEILVVFLFFKNLGVIGLLDWVVILSFLFDIF